MKVIIAGSRNFDNYDFLKQSIYTLLNDGYLEKMDTIVSGGARGADRLGERFATDYDLRLIVFPADWDSYGKRAGPIRNIEMANYADALIAFWDGQSRGTKHMIEAMQERQKEIHIINFTVSNG